MKRRSFLFVSAVAGVSGAGESVYGQQSKISRSKRQLGIDTMLEVTQVPGIAIGGLINGRPFQQFAGIRSTSAKESITVKTYFPAASLSKPVFAWAVRDLVEKGKLEWDKPLNDYAQLGLSGEAKGITAKHVLTHGSGLPNWRFQADKDLVPEFTPGAKWQYSGEGIFLLQRVVETIVEVPMATYMKNKVLVPMGMLSSTYTWNPELESRAASGHDRRGLPLDRSLHFFERRNYEIIKKAGLQAESATFSQIVDAYKTAKAPALPVAIAPNMAGSLWTTAEDYPKFLGRVMGDISTHPREYRPLVDVNREIAWTLGLGVDRSARTQAWFHWGDGPGFKNFAWIEPASKSYLVFFTNGDHGLALYSWLARKLLAEDPAALNWL